MKLIPTNSSLFDRILKNPNSFPTGISLARISLFIGGYGVVISDTIKNEDAVLTYIRNDLYWNFNEWVAKRFEIRSAHNWQSIIDFEYESELEAFEATRKLWKKYKNAREKSISFEDTHSVDEKSLAIEKNSRLLEKIIERPALYLGYASVPRMRSYIDGYRFVLSELGLEVEDKLYDGFQDWIPERFHMKSDKNWDEIISFMGLSESSAFSLLKELWGKYKTEREKSKKI